MSLSAGARIGSYEIVAPLGAGGMGEVYRAHDSKLEREVAIKILPDALASDADRVARFEREAKTLAALNHPYIAHIHGLEDTGGVRALVMELVEGPTLADRLEQGSLPIDEALPIARQVAEALEAAHEQSIVHRDLKPANIKLRPDGTVKVLDFGLAKALEPVGSPAGAATLSPTLTVAGATQAGIILGTAAYMAPEQARGKPVDRRADIWAFGCVLFEMLTGRRAFEGDEISDVLARIIEREPNFNTLPAATPIAIRRLLRRCLEKDRKRRLPDIAVACLEIDDAVAPGNDAAAASAPVTEVQAFGWRRAVPWVAAGILTVFALALALALWSPWRTPPPVVSVRVEVGLGVDAPLLTDQGPAATISPDGRVLALVVQNRVDSSQLYLRRLDQLQATPLGGTANARTPFFSPDSQWLGFFADGKLKIIAATGGAAVTLCDAPNARGGWWGDDGTIVFQPNSRGTGGSVLQQIAAHGGGKPEPASTLGDDEETQRWPQLLPQSRGVLYTAAVAQGGYADGLIVVQPRPGGARKVLVRGGYFGRYLPSGHLTYLHDDTLFAAPFDLERLEVAGPFLPVVEHVTGSTQAGPGGGSGQITVSATGTAAYFLGGVMSGTVAIDWLERSGSGKQTPLRSTPSDWSNPRFSPDGQRLAVDIFDGRQSDVWIYDWSHDRSTRLTLEPGSHVRPEWTPDGRRVVFTWLQPGSTGMFWRRADGGGDIQRLTSSPNAPAAGSWHPSGKVLAFTQSSTTTNLDLMTLAVEGDQSSGWKPGKVTPLLVTPARESNPAFSPDGRWIAYVSDESGFSEVYVRSFPELGGHWLISTGGGNNPVWSRTRKELLYNTPEARIMVVSYNATPDSFAPDKPQPWSDARYSPRSRGVANIGGRPFDLHPDGERVAIAPAADAQTAVSDKLVFVFNFFDELRRIAPVK